jgi:hypothetical protein
MNNKDRSKSPRSHEVLRKHKRGRVQYLLARVIVWESRRRHGRGSIIITVPPATLNHCLKCLQGGPGLDRAPGQEGELGGAERTG